MQREVNIRGAFPAKAKSYSEAYGTLRVPALLSRITPVGKDLRFFAAMVAASPPGGKQEVSRYLKNALCNLHSLYGRIRTCIFSISSERLTV